MPIVVGEGYERCVVCGDTREVGAMSCKHLPSKVAVNWMNDNTPLSVRCDDCGAHWQIQTTSTSEVLDELKALAEGWPWYGDLGDKTLAQAIKAELTDYETFIGNTSTVFCEVTGGRISKPNTDARHVIAEVDERIEKAVNDADPCLCGCAREDHVHRGEEGICRVCDECTGFTSYAEAKWRARTEPAMASSLTAEPFEEAP